MEEPFVSVLNEQQTRFGHVAVRLKRHVVIIGGYHTPKDWELKQIYFSTRTILAYDIINEHWHTFDTDGVDYPHGIAHAAAALVGSYIYIHSGSCMRQSDTNALWKLKVHGGGFTWSLVHGKWQPNTPSPRWGHSAWEMYGMFWIFGGYGPVYDESLKDHGEFKECNAFYVNNQLHCFDPSKQEWTNVKSYGALPSPRWIPASTQIGNTLYLYGGDCDDGTFDDLHEFNMATLTWTQIENSLSKLHGVIAHKGPCFSLTAASNRHIILHKPKYGTWILDVTSMTWKQYKGAQGLFRNSYTATLSRYGTCLIFGGTCKTVNMFTVTVAPRNLKEIALRTLHTHKEVLRDKIACLPQQLQAYFST